MDDFTIDIDSAMKVMDEETPKEQPKEQSNPYESKPEQGTANVVNKTTTEPRQYNNNGNKQFNGKGGGFDPWKDPITPREINKNTLKRFDRTFTVASAKGNVPDEVLNKLNPFLETLTDYGFTFRSSVDTRDNLTMYVDGKFQRKEIYLPFKKFNQSVTAKLTRPSKFAYELTAKFHKAFDKLSHPVKGFLARNTHLILGGDCDTPINFIIIYTECGIETAKGIKFETAGNASYFITVADDLNIPIFNLKNENFNERFESFLNTFKN
jgi:hypothetical protein